MCAVHIKTQRQISNTLIKSNDQLNRISIETEEKNDNGTHNMAATAPAEMNISRKKSH